MFWLIHNNILLSYPNHLMAPRYLASVKPIEPSLGVYPSQSLSMATIPFLSLSFPLFFSSFLHKFFGSLPYFFLACGLYWNFYVFLFAIQILCYAYLVCYLHVFFHYHPNIHIFPTAIFLSLFGEETGFKFCFWQHMIFHTEVSWRLNVPWHLKNQKYLSYLSWKSRKWNQYPYDGSHGNMFELQ